MRIIGHLDMDAFFAAVEERDHEWLRGVPIVVGADPQGGGGRGVVSTANYKARRYGIHSAMPISKAWRLAKTAELDGKERTIFLNPHFSRYQEASDKIFTLLRTYTPMIEEASVDEAYFDLSFAGSYEKAEMISKEIKKKIYGKEKLTSSVGVGPNKLIAKIASDRQKPDGLTVVREEDAEQFLALLPIRVIPGVGPKTENFLKTKGVAFVKDLKKYSQSDLENMFGKWGVSLYEKIRGRNESPIQESSIAKSVGEQETFRYDTLDVVIILERLRILSDTVFRRFIRGGFLSFRTIGVVVRFANFETKTRAHTLGIAAVSKEILYFEALKLLMPFLDYRENPEKKLIRLIGVRVEKLQ